jgi:uncharacterized membrane protein
MSENIDDDLEKYVAKLLTFGTWAASGLIASGLLIGGFGATNLSSTVMIAGVGLFIALPAIRVATAVVYFFRIGDRRLGAISALVLAIILAGIGVGLLAKT